jgi:hypothetical protein
MEEEAEDVGVVAMVAVTLHQMARTAPPVLGLIKSVADRIMMHSSAGISLIRLIKLKTTSSRLLSRPILTPAMPTGMWTLAPPIGMATGRVEQLPALSKEVAGRNSYSYPYPWVKIRTHQVSGGYRVPIGLVIPHVKITLK